MNLKNDTKKREEVATRPLCAQTSGLWFAPSNQELFPFCGYRVTVS